MKEDEDGLCCCVCDEVYSDERVPRNLSCGHSLCTQCAEQIIARNRKCPECRQNFTAATVDELVVNFPLLRLARSKTATRPQRPQNTANEHWVASVKPVKQDRQPDAGHCVSHGMPLHLRCMSCQKWVCGECIVEEHPPGSSCRLVSVVRAVEEMKVSKIRDISSKISKAKENQQSFMANIESSQKAETHQKFRVSLLQSILNSAENLHRELTSKKESIMEKVDHLSNVVERLQQSQACMEEATTITETINAVSLADGIMAIVPDSLERRVPERVTLPRAPSVKTKDIIKLLKTDTSDIYTVEHTDQGPPRCAKMVIEDEVLYLHSLQFVRPASVDLSIPYDVVRKLLPKDSPTIFMDVEVRNRMERKVEVRMFGDTPRGQQAVLLCSGERGPSYRGTCFYEAGTVIQPGDLIRGGDYENNNGTGGRVIVTGITCGGVYHRSIVPGLMVGWPTSDDWRNGSFDIYLRRLPGFYDESGYGIVTSGLEILQYAAEQPRVTDAVVKDCGLVIPLTN